MTQNLIANATIRGIDRFSGPMAKMSANAMRGARKMANAGAISNKMARSMTRASFATNKMGRSMQGTGAIAMSMAATSLTHGMAKWDAAARKAQATALVWKDVDFKPVRSEMMRLARIYPAYVSQIALGTNELFMAGMKMDDVLAKNAKGMSVLEMMVQGSMASGQSFKTVGAGVTDVIMAMDMPWDTAEDKVRSFKRVNDLLAHGSSVFNQDYVQFLDTLSYTSPVAKAVGMDLETLISLSGALADAGIKSSKAGTGLRALMIKPLGLSGKKHAMLKNTWGIDIGDFIDKSSSARLRSGKNLAGFIGAATGIDVESMSSSFDGILKNPRFSRNVGLMGDKLMGVLRKNMDLSGQNKLIAPLLNDAVRDYTTAGFSNLRLIPLLKTMGARGMTVGDVADVFGLRHVPKALALIDQLMSGKFKKKHARIVSNYQDAAYKKAAIQMRGTLGDMNTMFSAFDAGSKIMMSRSGVWDEMGGKFRAVTSGIDYLVDSSPKLQKFALYSVMALGAMAPLGFAFMGIGSTLSVFAGALGLAASVGAPALLALGTGAKLLYDNWDAISGFSGDKFFAGLINGAMIADDLIRSVAGSIKSLFGYGSAAGSSGAAAFGPGYAASMLNQKGVTGFLMRRSVVEGSKGPWTWVTERWITAAGKIGGLFTDLSGLIRTQLGGAWKWLGATASGALAWLNSDVQAFGNWIDGATKGTRDFFKGLFGGFESKWEGSELAWVFKQMRGAITNMFGPAAQDGAEKQGAGLAAALYNPLTTLGQALTGQYGTAGFIASGLLAKNLIGPFAHVGANVAIIATAMGRLGLAIGKPLAKLLLLSKGFSKLGRLAKLGSLARRFTVIGVAITGVVLAWDKLKALGSGFMKGFAAKLKGSELQKVFTRIGGYIDALAIKFSGDSNLGQLGAKIGSALFTAFDKAAGAINKVLNGIEKLAGMLNRFKMPAWMQPNDYSGAFPPDSYVDRYGNRRKRKKGISGLIENAPKIKARPSRPLWRQWKSTEKFGGGAGFVGGDNFVDGILNPPKKSGAQPWGSGMTGKLEAEINGPVIAKLEGRGKVAVGIHIDSSPDFIARLTSAIATDDGKNIAPNVGVSGADGVAGN
jgi:Phage-related minor tail protein